MKNHPILIKIWHTTADIEPNDSHVTRNRNFWNSRWRRPPSWKSLFLAITHRLIVRFQQKFVRGSRTAWRQGLDDKLQFFKNSRWRTAAILKIVILPYLCEKIVRFWWNLVHYIRYWTQLQSRDLKLKFLKFKMAAAAILKIAFLAITHRPIVRFQRSKTVARQGLRKKTANF